jgi:hypothetical protein
MIQKARGAVLGVSLALATTAACGGGGGGKLRASSASVRDTDAEAGARDDASAAEREVGSPSPKHESGGGKRAATGGGKPRKADAPEEDYEVTHTDCLALADVYRAAWLRDERIKLDKQKFDAKLRARAEKNLEAAADKGSDNWLSQCRGVVDSPYPRSRLDCAVKARTVTRFNDCWEGRVKPGEDAKPGEGEDAKPGDAL